jgi:expansin (peptidoglycan-binding protein)
VTTSTHEAAPSPSPTSSNNNGNSGSGNSDVHAGGQATFFYQGGAAGACGQVHSDNDFICAMDKDLYGDMGNSAPICGKQVIITNTQNGKTVTVTVADECPTCLNSNSIDLSVAAFQQIADESQGVVPISWVYSS